MDKAKLQVGEDYVFDERVATRTDRRHLPVPALAMKVRLLRVDENRHASRPCHVQLLDIGADVNGRHQDRRPGDRVDVATRTLLATWADYLEQAGEVERVAAENAARENAASAQARLAQRRLRALGFDVNVYHVEDEPAGAQVGTWKLKVYGDMPFTAGQMRSVTTALEQHADEQMRRDSELELG